MATARKTTTKSIRLDYILIDALAFLKNIFGGLNTCQAICRAILDTAITHGWTLGRLTDNSAIFTTPAKTFPTPTDGIAEPVPSGGEGTIAHEIPSVKNHIDSTTCRDDILVKNAHALNEDFLVEGTLNYIVDSVSSVIPPVTANRRAMFADKKLEISHSPALAIDHSQVTKMNRMANCDESGLSALI